MLAESYPTIMIAALFTLASSKSAASFLAPAPEDIGAHTPSAPFLCFGKCMHSVWLTIRTHFRTLAIHHVPAPLPRSSRRTKTMSRPGARAIRRNRTPQPRISHIEQSLHVLLIRERFVVDIDRHRMLLLFSVLPSVPQLLFIIAIVVMAIVRVCCVA
jgi:hypothetical protein